MWDPHPSQSGTLELWLFLWMLNLGIRIIQLEKISISLGFCFLLGSFVCLFVCLDLCVVRIKSSNYVIYLQRTRKAPALVKRLTASPVAPQSCFKKCFCIKSYNKIVKCVTQLLICSHLLSPYCSPHLGDWFIDISICFSLVTFF